MFAFHERIIIRMKIRCPKCEGSGKNEDGSGKCSMCHGKRKVYR